MRDNILSLWDNLDSKSFVIEEFNNKYYKKDIEIFIDKVKNNLLSVAVFEDKKVFLDIKDRKVFIIIFLSLLELKSKPVLVPSEIKISDYFHQGCICISDNKKDDQIVNIEKDFSVNPGLNFDPENIEESSLEKKTAIYLYTSGSTGKPKLIPKSDKNLLAEVEELQHFLNVTKESAFYFTTPICHIYGFLNAFLLPLYTSSKIILDQKFTPQDIAAFVKKNNITHFVSTPSYYRMFTDLKLVDTFNNSQKLVSSSAPLPLDVSKKFYENNIKVTEIYGSTETGGIAYRVSAENAEWKLYSYVKVIEAWGDYTDIEDDEKVIELKIVSPAISVEYDLESGFNTGDVVAFAKENNFKLLGRNTRFVKIAGKRVDLRHVLEKIIIYFNEIGSSVLKEEQLYIGQMNEKLFLISEEKFPKSIKEVRDDLKHLLPSYSVPRLFINCKIPRNNMGKIKKSEIDKIVKEKKSF